MWSGSPPLCASTWHSAAKAGDVQGPAFLGSSSGVMPVPPACNCWGLWHWYRDGFHNYGSFRFRLKICSTMPLNWSAQDLRSLEQMPCRPTAFLASILISVHSWPGLLWGTAIRWCTQLLWVECCRKGGLVGVGQHTEVAAGQGEGQMKIEENGSDHSLTFSPAQAGRWVSKMVLLFYWKTATLSSGFTWF